MPSPNSPPPQAVRLDVAVSVHGHDDVEVVGRVTFFDAERLTSKVLRTWAWVREGLLQCQ